MTRRQAFALPAATLCRTGLLSSLPLAAPAASSSFSPSSAACHRPLPDHLLVLFAHQPTRLHRLLSGELCWADRLQQSF